MILFFDTETTGIPFYRLPSEDPSQPHLVQLALLLCEDDGAEVNASSVLIRPDGWEIHPDATAIHGISNERALTEGIPEKDAVNSYIDALGKTSFRVAHNESFDCRIMRIAMLRSSLARDTIEALERMPSFCTLQAATPIVNLPPTERMLSAGFNKPKPPKLAECMRHFFDEDMVGAHDALVDVRACARVYFHLKKMQEGVAA